MFYLLYIRIFINALVDQILPSRIEIRRRTAFRRAAPKGERKVDWLDGLVAIQLEAEARSAGVLFPSESTQKSR